MFLCAFIYSKQSTSFLRGFDLKRSVNMIITSRYHCVQESQDTIRICSFQDVVCDQCDKKMIVHDSRKRGVLDRDGKKYYIRHRRLQCRDCGCCHSELPDFLLPYKRYSGEVILQIFFQKESRSREAISEVVDCAAENRTIRRWDLWIAASFCQFIIVQVKALQSDSNLLFFLLKSTFQLVHSKIDSIQFQLQFSNVLKLLSCFSGVDCRWI